jgi:hypothetical protein
MLSDDTPRWEKNPGGRSDRYGSGPKRPPSPPPPQQPQDEGGRVPGEDEPTRKTTRGERTDA